MIRNYLKRKETTFVFLKGRNATFVEKNVVLKEPDTLSWAFTQVSNPMILLSNVVFKFTDNCDSLHLYANQNDICQRDTLGIRNLVNRSSLKNELNKFPNIAIFGIFMKTYLRCPQLFNSSIPYQNCYINFLAKKLSHVLEEIGLALKHILKW